MMWLKTFQPVQNLPNWGHIMSESMSDGLAAGVFIKVAVGLVAMGSGLETGGVGQVWYLQKFLYPNCEDHQQWYLQGCW